MHTLNHTTFRLGIFSTAPCLQSSSGTSSSTAARFLFRPPAFWGDIWPVAASTVSIYVATYPAAWSSSATWVRPASARAELVDRKPLPSTCSVSQVRAPPTMREAWLDPHCSYCYHTQSPAQTMLSTWKWHGIVTHIVLWISEESFCYSYMNYSVRTDIWHHHGYHDSQRIAPVAVWGAYELEQRTGHL